MVEASITVPNLGDLGAESVYGVIHPPQVALVGFGSVHNEAWPDDAVLTIRPTVHTSLAGDHRASDGLAGSRFLAQLQAIVNTIISEERERSTTNDPRRDQPNRARRRSVQHFGRRHVP